MRLPTSTLFPYTTLFRSSSSSRRARPRKRHARLRLRRRRGRSVHGARMVARWDARGSPDTGAVADRKSTRLNSSHVEISYAVFCLKKTSGCGHRRRGCRRRMRRLAMFSVYSSCDYLLLLSFPTRRSSDLAQALAALGHENVMRVYDYGEDEAGPYMALEWLHGGTLEDRLTRGPLQIGRAHV